MKMERKLDIKRRKYGDFSGIFRQLRNRKGKRRRQSPVLNECAQILLCAVLHLMTPKEEFQNKIFKNT